MRESEKLVNARSILLFKTSKFLAGSKIGFLLVYPETTMGTKTFYFKQKKMLCFEEG